jgi:hypothetical protein
MKVSEADVSCKMSSKDRPRGVECMQGLMSFLGFMTCTILAQCMGQGCPLFNSVLQQVAAACLLWVAHVSPCTAPRQGGVGWECFREGGLVMFLCMHH